MEWQLLKQKHLLDLKNSPGEKTPYIHGFWKFAKMSTFIPFPYSSGSVESSQAGWLSDSFIQKRALTGETMVLSQAEMR